MSSNQYRGNFFIFPTDFLSEKENYLLKREIFINEKTKNKATMITI